MPKFDNNDVKTNGIISFRDSTHTYWDNNPKHKYVSVTTLIGKFEQPFDEDFMSKYKALETFFDPETWKIEKKQIFKTKKIPKEFLEAHSINEEELKARQKEILNQWAKTRDEACERGTRIHAELENSMYEGGDNVSLEKYGVGGKFKCVKGHSVLDLENGVYPEYLIHRVTPDEELCIAGQIDLLVKKGNTYSCIDWKTNREIKTKSFYNQATKSSVKMKFPLNNLDDTNYWHYCLQLSTYAFMIEKLDPNAKIGDLILVHFDHNDNMTTYHCPYLREEVIKMLNYYKKQQKLEERRNARKKIEY